MKKSQKEERHSTRVLTLFILIVGFLIGVSITIKVIGTVQKSLFDGKHRFTFLYSPDRKESTIYSLDPDSSSITILNINNKQELRRPELALAIPVDATVTSLSFDLKQDLDDALLTLLTSYTKIQSEITWYDLIRLYFISKIIQEKDIQKIDITLPDDQLSFDAKINNGFFDSLIVKEDADIAIINASGVAGLGGKMEQYVKRLGGTVVSVTTARDQEGSSAIQYASDESQTVERLHALLKFELQKMKKKEISDIVIILGSDLAEKRIF